MRIAYLAEQRLSINGLDSAFRFIYPQAEIVKISAADIQKEKVASCKILILPGNNTEDSPYPEFMNAERIETLRSAMEDDGLVLITFCAASYFMADRILYETKKGEIKERAGAGFIKGTATHAFRHCTRPSNPQNQLQDYIEANITSPMANIPMRILNVNGPAFHLDEEENSEIFLKYVDTKGAAGVFKKIGLKGGMLVALGVHPELSSRNSDKKFSGLFNDHEEDRYALLHIIRNIIEDRNIMLPQIKDVQPHYVSCDNV